MSFIGIYKAVYSYEPQADQELAIDENDILYLLEKSEIDDWWTVKKRIVGADVDEPVGLVPSNYIEPADIIGSATALYDYDKQTDEELTFKENEAFDVFDDKDQDWILVKKQNKEEYGFVPSNYIELRKGTAAPSLPVNALPPPTHPSLAASNVNATAVNNDRTEEDPTPALPSVPRPTSEYDNENYDDAPPPKPARPGQDSSSRRASRQSSYSDEEYETRSQQKPQRRARRDEEETDDNDQLYTWQVSEVDGRKKKKAMLAIGNSTIYFSPDSVNGKSPQQWKIKDLLSFSSEKKHLFFEFRNPLYSLEIHAGSKDVAAQISTIVEELKGSVSNASLKEVKDATNGKGPKRKGKVLFDFEAQGSDELTVFEGDMVYIINDKKSKDWWMVEHAETHKAGVVPAQFVQPLKESSSSSSISTSFASKFKLSRSKSKENLRSPSKEEKSQKLSTPKPSRVRTWNDRTGTFKVDAEFLGVVEGKIHLHKTNGVKIAVAAPKLSLVDLEYVERVTGMSLETYKAAKSSSSRTRSADQEKERNERRERERKRRERDQKERERDQREREEDERERERERARWDKAREKEYREREKERAEREKDRKEREYERQERERLRQDLDEAKQLALDAKRSASADIAPQQPSRPTSTQAKQREAYDWFEFFLEAGVDVNQCQRYSSNFKKEEIDPNILESIDSSVLRTLGLKEGDIIRVNRYIDAKFNRQPKETNNGGLFSEPSGALKVKRTGSANLVGNEFPKATASSADDDAWTVKPAANNESSAAAPALTQQFTGSMQDLVNLKPLQPTATSSSIKSNTYAPVPPNKVLEPTKTAPVAVAPQKTGHMTAQPTGLVPLDPFKTGGGNILPLSTGGAFVYLPIQQTGAIALQPTGLIPLQKTGQALSFQTTGLVPLQKTGGAAPLPIGGLPTFGTTAVLPLQRTGGFQATFTGGLPAAFTGGLPQQSLLTGGLPPTTTFGQIPAALTGQKPLGFNQPLMNPALTGGLPAALTGQQPFGFNQPLMNPALTGGMPAALTGGLPQPSFGLNQPSTFNGLGSTSFNQPVNTFNSGLPPASFNAGLPATSFGAQPMNQPLNTGFQQQNFQQTGFQQTGFQPQPQFNGFNQMNQLQNQFQSTSISSPPTFNSFQQQPQQPQFGQFGQQPQPTFNGFGNSAAPQQPLEAQPTGFGFGNNPQTQGAQRANLANASAENPFGF